MKIFSGLIILTLILIAAAGCSKKDGGGIGENKLSPPSWIQGTWGAEGYEAFKFTSDDIIIEITGEAPVSFKHNYNIDVPGGKISTKETIKNDAIYEITVTATAMGEESESGFFSFKKGDGTYIMGCSAETGTDLDDEDYVRLDKL